MSTRLRASPVRDWSAWLPIATPLFLLALGARHLALYGLVRETDEGTEAHLFQLLMPVQLVLIAWFAATWSAHMPRIAAVMLSAQLLLTGVLVGIVWWIDHMPLPVRSQRRLGWHAGLDPTVDPRGPSAAGCATPARPRTPRPSST